MDADRRSWDVWELGELGELGDEESESTRSCERKLSDGSVYIFRPYDGLPSPSSVTATDWKSVLRDDSIPEKVSGTFFAFTPSAKPPSVPPNRFPPTI